MGGFFFGALLCGVLSAVGIPVDFNRDLHGGGMGAGAAVAMAAVVIWLGATPLLAIVARSNRYR